LSRAHRHGSLTVAVPKETRLVTGFLAPYDKRYVLSSKAVSDRLTRLGEASLRSFLSDPTIDTLAEEGERFSKALGLESVEVKKLIGLAKAAGAVHASQNMVGYSIHALTSSDVSERVAKALRSFSREIRVDTFEIGSRRGGVY
jgi:pantoate kinase